MVRDWLRGLSDQLHILYSWLWDCFRIICLVIFVKLKGKGFTGSLND